MDKQFDKVRRSDRQETDVQFLHLLLNSSMSCSLGISTEKFPLIHSTFFVYDKANDEIIFHFSKHGFGGQEIQNDRKVAISIYKYGKLYTAEKAIDFGCEYESVIVYGKVRIVEDNDERLQAMKIFFNKFFNHIPQNDYKETNLSEISSIYIIKVKIDKWFGKQHLVPEKALKSFYAPFDPVI